MAVHNLEDARRVYYLSLEFLMGRLFNNAIYSVGLYKETEQALQELGLNLEDLRGEEYDMGLGNGGLGRLAACFLDSWPRSTIRRSATAFTTSSACSGRSSATGTRSNCPMTG